MNRILGILGIAALVAVLLSLQPRRAEAACVVQGSFRYCFPPGTDNHVWEGYIGEDYNFFGDALSQMIVWYDRTAEQCGDIDFIGDGWGLTMDTIVQDAGYASQNGNTYLGAIQTNEFCGQELRVVSTNGHTLNFVSYYGYDTIVSTTSTESHIDCLSNSNGSCNAWTWNDGVVYGSDGSDLIVRLGGSGNSLTYSWGGDDFIYNWSGQNLTQVYCGLGNDTFDGPYWPSSPPDSCETIY
jgi:hypothetical protein